MHPISDGGDGDLMCHGLLMFVIGPTPVPSLPPPGPPQGGGAEIGINTCVMSFIYFRMCWNPMGPVDDSKSTFLEVRVGLIGARGGRGSPGAKQSKAEQSCRVRGARLRLFVLIYFVYLIRCHFGSRHCP